MKQSNKKKKTYKKKKQYELEYIQQHYTYTQVKREQKQCRNAEIIMVILDIILFLAGGLFKLTGSILMILYAWILYTRLYPKSFISIHDLTTMEETYFINFPFIGPTFALVLAFSFSNGVNFNNKQMILFTIITAIFLLSPLFMKIRRLKRKENIIRILSICVTAFMISFTFITNLLPSLPRKQIGNDRVAVLQKTEDYSLFTLQYQLFHIRRLE